MNKTFSTGLNNKELNQLQKKLENWAEMMDKASKEIVSDIANYGLEEMQKIYNGSNFESSTPMDFGITGTDYEKQVFMSGEQALYCEFGTGTEGENRPHPIKSEFELNDYNSGKTIRPMSAELKAKKGIPIDGLYWTYKDSDGNIVYTQGIPAQKEGYDSLMNAIKKAPEIVKKRMEETLK